MKIIIITEKDAANISLSFIVKELKKRGHGLCIYAPFYFEGVLKYFPDGIIKKPIEELERKDVDSCDMIFCSTLSSIYLPEFVFTARKPIFTHNYLMNRQINWGGDICFVPSVATVASDYDEYLGYSYIGIGEPKYDGQENITAAGKRFLFIDSGHYPFSDEGKRELAGTLLHICEKYPDYELWIKPRFLPGDKVVTHRNSIHLYQVIRELAGGEIPPNMVMLDRHEDLKKLINESTTVICMYTTAFVGAVVAGKGLIVLEDLKTTDVYDIRHKAYMRNRESMAGSGALIDYRDVDRLLPEGAKGTLEYLDFLLEEKENVAEKICEVCEGLWKSYYSQNRFPVRADSVYKTYKDDFTEDTGMTWDKYISRRCHDYILLKSLILIDFHVKAKLDIGYVLKEADRFCDEKGLVTEKAFRSFLKSANDIRDNCLIRNRELLLQDDVDAGILLNAYYLQKKYEKIREFPLKEIAAFDFYRAMAAAEDEAEKDPEAAEKYLRRYFDKTKDRKFCLEISDMSDNRFRAFMTLINVLLEKKELKDAKLFLDRMEEYYKLNYQTGDVCAETDNKVQRARRDFIVHSRERAEKSNG